jgi:hypothetical protein
MPPQEISIDSIGPGEVDALGEAADAIARKRESASPRPVTTPPADEDSLVDDRPEPEEDEEIISVQTDDDEDTLVEEDDTRDEDATDDEDEAGQEPTLTVPSRWSAEDKAWFKTLPPERQQRLLAAELGAQRAESKRQADYQTLRRQTEELTRQSQVERQHLQQAVAHYKHPMVKAFEQEFTDLLKGETDLFRLSQDPERWGRYQAFQTSFSQIAQTEKVIQEKAAAEENARIHNLIQGRNAELVKVKPELSDPQKFAEFDDRITNYATTQGISHHRLALASIAEIKLVEKAMKYDAAVAAARKTKPQKVELKPGQVRVKQHVRQVSRTMRPGAGGQGGSLRAERVSVALKQARRTGDIADVAALIRAKGETRAR